MITLGTRLSFLIGFTSCKSPIAYSVQPVSEPASRLPGDATLAKAKPRETVAEVGLYSCCSVRDPSRRLVPGRSWTRLLLGLRKFFEPIKVFTM